MIAAVPYLLSHDFPQCAWVSMMYDVTVRSLGKRKSPLPNPVRYIVIFLRMSQIHRTVRFPLSNVARAMKLEVASVFAGFTIPGRA